MAANTQAIMTFGWYTGDAAADVRAIATFGWWVTPEPDETISGAKVTSYRFRIPNAEMPREVRKAFQDLLVICETQQRLIPRSGTVFPTDPLQGSLFYHEDDNLLYMYVDGPGWVELGSTGGGGEVSTNYFLLMSAERFTLMNSENFTLMEPA